jgi:hypothetical protein
MTRYRTLFAFISEVPIAISSIPYSTPSCAPEVYTKVSDTKKTMTTSFTETPGRVVNVKETCLES